MPAITPSAVARIRNLPSLLGFCADELGWPLDPTATLDDATFDYRADELRVQPAQATRLKGGVVRQLRDLRRDQPWGVFLVEFNEPQVYKTALRQVLRGLVPSRRGSATQRTWAHENLLFICTTRDYDRFTFAHFRGQEARRAVLTTFGWQRGDGHVRTLCEYNLPGLRFPEDGGTDPQAWLARWQSAFDVETVTRHFFTTYRAVFEAAERQIAGITGDARRLFTQKLFNRLMFLAFLERKGWLSFGARRDYLRALWEDHRRDLVKGPEANLCQSKYYRNWRTGQIDGYGKKLLP